MPVLGSHMWSFYHLSFIKYASPLHTVAKTLLNVYKRSENVNGFTVNQSIKSLEDAGVDLFLTFSSSFMTLDKFAYCYMDLAMNLKNLLG